MNTLTKDAFKIKKSLKTYAVFFILYMDKMNTFFCFMYGFVNILNNFVVSNYLNYNSNGLIDESLCVFKLLITDILLLKYTPS